MTVYGQRAVGDVSQPVDEMPGATIHGTFVTSDAFGMPPHEVPDLPPPGTRIRVTERGWMRCPCCGRPQPNLRGGGVGVIECHATGQFKLYRLSPGVPPLTPAPDEA